MNQRVQALTERGFKHMVFTLCAYECVAIATSKCPTLSRLSHDYKWLGPILVTGLSVHLVRYARKLEAEIVKEVVEEVLAS